MINASNVKAINCSKLIKGVAKMNAERALTNIIKFVKNVSLTVKYAKRVIRVSNVKENTKLTPLQRAASSAIKPKR